VVDRQRVDFGLGMRSNLGPSRTGGIAMDPSDLGLSANLYGLNVGT
jgi:hypothetical protein